MFTRKLLESLITRTGPSGGSPGASAFLKQISELATLVDSVSAFHNHDESILALSLPLLETLMWVSVASELTIFRGVVVGAHFFYKVKSTLQVVATREMQRNI